MKIRYPFLFTIKPYKKIAFGVKVKEKQGKENLFSWHNLKGKSINIGYNVSGASPWEV